MRRVIVSRRLLVLPLAGAVTCAVLAGCGGAVTVDATSTAAAPGSGSSAPAAKATVPMPSATLAGGTSTPVAPPRTGTPVPGDDVATAVRDAVGAAKSVSMRFTTQAGAGTAKVDIEHKALRLTVGDEANPVTLVRAQGSTWVKGAGTVTAAAAPSGTTSPAPTTRRWLQLRPDGQDVLSRRLGPATDVEAMLRPAAFADLFAGLTGDETKTDEGRRISFWVPAKRYVEVVRGPGELSAALTKPVIVVVDLDERDRPVRLVATMTSDTSTIIDDTTYSDWDAPVDVSAPPTEEVGVAPEPTPSGGSEQPQDPEAGTDGGATGPTDGQPPSDSAAPSDSTTTSASGTQRGSATQTR